MSDEPRTAGFFTTMRAVLWSFAGIRKGSDYKEDSARLNPLAIVVAGVLGGVIFVLVLVSVVKLVVAQH